MEDSFKRLFQIPHNTFGVKKCSLLNQSKTSYPFTYYLEQAKTNYLIFLYLFSKDMWHMIFENPKMFVDSYICENYSNECKRSNPCTYNQPEKFVITVIIQLHKLYYFNKLYNSYNYHKFFRRL